MMACFAHTLRSSFEPSPLLFVLYTFVAGLDKVRPYLGLYTCINKAITKAVPGRDT